MLVSPVQRTSEVNPQERIAGQQAIASSAQDKAPIPQDTVTLSPAAQALQAEQTVLANAAENQLSPAAQALQAEQDVVSRNATNSAAMLWSQQWIDQ